MLKSTSNGKDNDHNNSRTDEMKIGLGGFKMEWKTTFQRVPPKDVEVNDQKGKVPAIRNSYPKPITEFRQANDEHSSDSTQKSKQIEKARYTRNSSCKNKSQRTKSSNYLNVTAPEANCRKNTPKTPKNKTTSRRRTQTPKTFTLKDASFESDDSSIENTKGVKNRSKYTSRDYSNSKRSKNVIHGGTSTNFSTPKKSNVVKNDSRRILDESIVSYNYSTYPDNQDNKKHSSRTSTYQSQNESLYEDDFRSLLSSTMVDDNIYNTAMKTEILFKSLLNKSFK